jgi:putative membrane protein
VTTPPPGTRTGLAWQRTGLGLIAIAALIGARAFNTGESSLLLIAGAGGLFGAGVLGVMGPVRQGLLQRRMAADDDVAAPGAVAFMTCAVVLLAVLAGVAVIVVPSD